MRSSAGSPVCGRRCDSVETNIGKYSVKNGERLSDNGTVAGAGAVESDIDGYSVRRGSCAGKACAREVRFRSGTILLTFGP